MARSSLLRRRAAIAVALAVIIFGGAFVLQRLRAPRAQAPATAPAQVTPPAAPAPPAVTSYTDPLPCAAAGCSAPSYTLATGTLQSLDLRARRIRYTDAHGALTVRSLARDVTFAAIPRIGAEPQPLTAATVQQRAVAGAAIGLVTATEKRSAAVRILYFLPPAAATAASAQQ